VSSAGSTGPRQERAAAKHIADRFGSELRPIVATDDSHVDLEAAREIAPDVEEHPSRSVDVLGVLSERAALVVVGSRGLHGLAALGSVSERVAHDARCSVLVVRNRAG